ncbi:MAG: lysine aminoacylase GenX [Schlesneria sp.]|nr:lysine aminoacylase GenX [Schlesneria sp.]
MTDFHPTASLSTLRQRALLLRAMRRFFDEAGYFEVETPLLSQDIVVDAWLEPFVAAFLPRAEDWQQPAVFRYLQTSPEFAMKRLLVAGATAIYQMGKVFRNGEVGQRHNPEFTMLEWYRVGDDHHDQMSLTEELVRCVAKVAAEFPESEILEEWRLRRSQFGTRVLSSEPFERLAYDDAFASYAGRRVLGASTSELKDLAKKHQLVAPPSLAGEDSDGWLNWLLAELVEPELGRERPTFLHGYPPSQAALARTSVGEPSVAERFELYIDGVELCNGYHELTDAAVLRQRIQEQLGVRAAAGLRPLPAESRLLAAMEAGLPPCAGNALGVDRLIMLALGATHLSDVIAFPFDRA